MLNFTLKCVCIKLSVSKKKGKKRVTVGKEREKGGCEEASMAVEREPGEALTIMVI